MRQEHETMRQQAAQTCTIEQKWKFKNQDHESRGSCSHDLYFFAVKCSFLISYC
jgi:hypothetical protein